MYKQNLLWVGLGKWQESCAKGQTNKKELAIQSVFPQGDKEQVTLVSLGEERIKAKNKVKGRKRIEEHSHKREKEGVEKKKKEKKERVKRNKKKEEEKNKSRTE